MDQRITSLLASENDYLKKVDGWNLTPNFLENYDFKHIHDQHILFATIKYVSLHLGFELDISETGNVEI